MIPLKKRLLTMLPFLCVMAATFYALPLLIQDTGSAIFILLVAIPIICLCTAGVYGALHGFHWLYPFLSALLFLPTIFIFYNDSALIYVAAYGLLAALGCAVGTIVYKVGKRK